MKFSFASFSNILFLLLVLLAGIGSHLFHHKNTTPTVSQEDFFAQNPLRQLLFKNKKKFFSKSIDAAQLYFKGDYSTTKHWEPGLQETDEEKEKQYDLFGYHLNIEHIVDKTPGINKAHNRPTLYFHGWGDNKNSVKIFKKYIHGLPGDVVAFDFPDAHGFLSLWRKAGFGQITDVLPALYALNYAYEHLGLSAIDLYGVSRGGATVVNLIAVLNDKTGAFDEELTRIGINERRRAELLRIIERGCLVLDCPLRDMNLAVSDKFPRFLSNLPMKLLSGMSRYQEDGLQAHTSAQKLNGLKLNTLLHFQHNDNMVTNIGEAEFYATLFKNNPRTTYLVLGDDGGHVHSHASLSRTIHTFKKIFNGSFDPHMDEFYTAYVNSDSPEKLESILLQPADAQECIASFHSNCKKKKEKVHQERKAY